LGYSEQPLVQKTGARSHDRDRLSTVRKADSIIVLNQGEIVEHGIWEALLSRPDSLFAGMVQAGAQ